MPEQIIYERWYLVRNDFGGPGYYESLSDALAAAGELLTRDGLSVTISTKDKEATHQTEEV